MDYFFSSPFFSKFSWVKRRFTEAKLTTFFLSPFSSVSCDETCGWGRGWTHWPTEKKEGRSSNGSGLPNPLPWLRTAVYRHFSYILIKISVMFTSHSIKKKEAMSNPIKYTKFWFKLSFASKVYNYENMCNNWTILAKWKWIINDFLSLNILNKAWKGLGPLCWCIKCL